MLRNQISQIKNRTGRDEIRNALIPIGPVRTHADFPIAPDFHADERMLDSGNRLATVQHKSVIDECHAPSTRNPSGNCLD